MLSVCVDAAGAFGGQLLAGVHLPANWRRSQHHDEKALLKLTVEKVAEDVADEVLGVPGREVLDIVIRIAGDAHAVELPSRPNRRLEHPQV